MGTLYLTSLADCLRGAGLTVIEQSGWKTRASNSGGLNGLFGIIVHHTASPSSWDGKKDSDYLTRGHQYAPVGNLYLDRKGQWWVQAAGSSNTAGKGGPWTTSRGTVPLNSANSRTINIEAGNNGVGEYWPVAQQDSYVMGCAMLCKEFGLKPLTDIYAHFEWAPTRKIDPAGNSKYATGNNKWNMDLFRDDVNEIFSFQPPVTLPEGDDVPYLILKRNDAAKEGYACFASGNVRRVTGWEFQNLVLNGVGVLTDSAGCDNLAIASQKMYGV